MSPQARSTNSSSARSAGARSESEFIRALVAHALSLVDLSDPGHIRGLTTTELEAASGLSRPPVTTLIDRFRPVLEAQDAVGSPVEDLSEASRWALASNVGIVAGVALGAEQPAAVALGDLYGRIVSPVIVQEDETTADKALDWTVETIRGLVEGRPATDVVGVGVSIATPIDRATGVIRAASPRAEGRNEARWEDWLATRIRGHLTRRLDWPHAPVLLDNDANLNALAEYIWGAARPTRQRDLHGPPRNVVYVEWSKGIGIGLILEREIYRGAGLAGEIGYTVMHERNGEAERLELIAGTDAIVHAAMARCGHQTQAPQNLMEAIERAREVKTATEPFDEAGRELGRALGPVIDLLNPDMVIIGGDIGRLAYDLVKPELLKALQDYTMLPALTDAAVVEAEVLQDPVLHGAFSLMLRPTPGDDDGLLQFARRKCT